MSMRHKLLRGMLGGGGSLSPLQTLLNKFLPVGGINAVVRCKISGPTAWWTMYQHLAGRTYYNTTLACADMTVGLAPMRQTAAQITEYYQIYNNLSTTKPTVNATWSANTSLGGGYYIMDTAGKYIQLVTPTGVTSVGVGAYPSLTGAGIFLVTIDGDATLADLLPTAQDLVTAGTLAATALVGGGGTLNPTDRVFDNYGLTNNYGTEATHNGIGGAYIKLITDSLVAGSHTVRFTLTAYRNVSASGGLFSGLNGIFCAGSDAYAAGGAGIPMFLVKQDLAGAEPVWDVSYNFNPGGNTSYEWLGHTGSRVIASLPTCAVDGTDVTAGMVHGVYFSGSEVVISTPDHIRHPATGATNQGTWDALWKMHKTTGFTISHTTTWSTAGLATGYPCMMSVLASLFDRYATLGGGLALSSEMAANDGSAHCKTDQSCAYTWDSDGYAAMLMYIPDLALTVENWTKSLAQLYWADFPGGVYEKAYAQRFGVAPEAYTNGTAWQSETNYRCAWVPSGVNALMA